MSRSKATLQTPKRVSASSIVRGSGWLGLAVGVALLLATSRVVVSDWLEPVSSEIPSWKAAALGSSATPANQWALDVDPQVLRAARLLIPEDAPPASHDRWWFPAEVERDGQRYAARAQLLSSDGSEEGVRVRFTDANARPDGIESIEFVVADGQRHGIEWLARETAREVGLVAAPSGFARLEINGGDSQIVYWRENASAAMLQRVGYPPSEIFRANPSSSRGPTSSLLPAHYTASLDGKPSRSHAASLRALVAWIDADEPASPTDSSRHLGELVDIDKLVAWEALTTLFGARDAREVPSDWYFDPITGLLEPVVSAVEAPPAKGAQHSEAGVAAHRLLQLPEYRAMRDARLREWAGATHSLLLAEAEQRLGDAAAGVAAGSSWYNRARDLASLARLRREARERLLASAAELRVELAGSEPAPQLATGADSSGRQLASDAAAEERARAWAARTGLPFEIDAGWLTLPAGLHGVDETLIVPASHRLRIAPGAHLVMAPKASLISFRGIQAIGTRRAPISISAADPERPWGTIGVARAPETSEFAYVSIDGGSDAKIAGIEFSGQLSINGADVVIRDSDVLRGHGDDSFSIKRGFFQVSRSRFIDNRSDGLDAEWSTGSIEQSLFASNGDDGLDLGTSEVRVHRTWFRRMGDKAISAGESSRVSVTNSQLLDSQIAIASKEDSRVEVRGSEFRRNEIGISLYRDSAIFGSGYGVVSGGLFSENLRDFAVEAGSGLTLNGVERRASDDTGIVVGLRNSPTSSSIQ